MSVEDQTVSFSLEINVQEAYTELRKVETILYRTMSLIRRMGGTEELDDLVRKIQMTIALVNQLRLTIIALQAASGPVGWALAGIGIVSTALTTGDLIGSFNYDATRGR